MNQQPRPMKYLRKNTNMGASRLKTKILTPEEKELMKEIEERLKKNSNWCLQRDLWWHSNKNNCYLKSNQRTSLVVQWLRIHLPRQEAWVQSLLREDPTCHRATKPVRHNYWAWALEPMSHNYWSPHATTTEAHTPRAHALQQEKPLQQEKKPPQREAHAPQQRVAPTHRN